MSKITLASYTLRVKSKADGNKMPLGKFDNRADLVDVCRDYLSERTRDASHDILAKNVIRVSQLNVESRLLTGVLQTGGYGFTSDLLDVDSGEIAHKRSTQEAEMLPFYFLFDVPEKADEGIVILQRFRIFGIRKLLLEDFQKFFAEKHPEHRIEINPLMPESLLERYKSGSGRITKAQFVRFAFPSDIVDQLGGEDHKEELGQMEVIIHAKRNKSLPLWATISKFFKGEREVKRLLEIKDFEYDNVKIEVDLNGNRRTIDLSQPTRLRAYFDITDKLNQNSTGHPAYNEIDILAKDLLAELNQSLRGGENAGEDQRKQDSQEPPGDPQEL